MNKHVFIASAFLIFSFTAYSQYIPYMVEDINPGSATGTQIGSLKYIGKELNGILYFTANDGTNGFELWRSDGNPAGTYMVKDINTNPGIGSFINFFFLWNNEIYFTADDGISGNELWKTDGTTSGTILVKDIRNGLGSSNPYKFIDSGNGFFYFEANDGINGQELWKSDGTMSGTILVKDIAAGSSGSSFYGCVNMGGNLYFAANDGVNGVELWKSDGTNSGTFMVKDIAPGSAPSSPRDLNVFNSELYFHTNYSKLWKSDGTASGTSIFVDPSPGEIEDIFSGTGGLFFSVKYYSVTSNDENKLFVTSGIIGDTIQLISLSGDNCNAFFLGEISGSVIYQQSGDFLIGSDDNLVFSNGTIAGTNLIYDSVVEYVIRPDNGLPYLNSSVLFPVLSLNTGMELAKYDGTSVSILKDIYPGTGNGMFGGLSQWSLNTIIYENSLYFVANNGVTGDELWATDGTGSGTSLVKDINVGSYSCFSSTGGDFYFNPVIAGNKMFFLANDGVYGTELWCISVTNGINENNTQNGVTIYPVPATDKINVVFYSEQKSNLIGEIYDISGKIVHEFSDQNISTGKNTLSCSIDHLTPGLYFLKLIFENNQVMVSRFLKSPND